jgi:hypothetical protein
VAGRGAPRAGRSGARTGSPIRRAASVLVLGRRLVVVAIVVVAVLRIAVGPRRGSVRGRLGRQLRPPVVQDPDALLDAGEGLRRLGLERLEDLEGVVVGAGANLIASGVSVVDDLPALGLGELEQSPLGDEERRLLLGPADDPARFLVRNLDDPLALGIDPFRGPNLLRDGDAELVDEVEDRVPIDDDVPCQGQGLAGRDEGLEPLEEEDDVQRRGLRGGQRDRFRGLSHGRRAHLRAPSAASRARAATGGTISDTSPPNAAISLTRLELT